MKFLLTIAWLLFMFTCTANCQWQRVLLGGKALYADNVLFFDGKKGLCATAGGIPAMFETTDGGRFWTKIKNDTLRTINFQGTAIMPLGGLRYVAVFYDAILIGEFGNGYKKLSWDSNAEFTPCLDDVGWSDVSVVDQRHVWVSSENGIVYSSDAGETWECRAINTKRQHKNIVFIDSLTGVSSNRFGSHYTRDGGLSWTPSTFVGFTGEYYGLVRSASNVTFLVGSVVSRSDDSGTTFTHISNVFPACSSFAFCDANYGWIGGQSKFMQTTNGGTSWNDVKDDSLFKGLDFRVTGISPVSCDTVFAVGGGYLYYNFNARNLVSVEEENPNGMAGFQIYPNPTDGMVTISTTDEISSATVMDMLGNVVMSAGFQSATTKYTLDISPLPRGMYVVRVEATNGAVTRMVIKD